MQQIRCFKKSGRVGRAINFWHEMMHSVISPAAIQDYLLVEILNTRWYYQNTNGKKYWILSGFCYFLCKSEVSVRDKGLIKLKQLLSFCKAREEKRLMKVWDLVHCYSPSIPGLSQLPICFPSRRLWVDLTLFRIYLGSARKSAFFE